jgi:hypothetical protein
MGRTLGKEAARGARPVVNRARWSGVHPGSPVGLIGGHMSCAYDRCMIPRVWLVVTMNLCPFIVRCAGRLRPRRVVPSPDRPTNDAAETGVASYACRDSSPRARRTSVRADCSHEPRESPRQSRPGLGEMTNEEVGGSIRYGVGIDAEEHVIGSFDPLHLAGSTDCLQRLMHQCALFRR